ncbi:MAG: chromosomal replication initiator protein DnaA [Bacteroidetes bacterium]|nr:chromosomal replication initiator protein DnaA [Bacteroidota bacterium]
MVELDSQQIRKSAIEKIDVGQAWKQCVDVIKAQVTGPSFRTWISPIEPAKIENGRLILMLPNQFFIEWIEGRYTDLIVNALRQVTSEDLGILYKVKEGAITPLEQTSFQPDPQVTVHTGVRVLPDKFESLLNHRYTFDSFIEGNSNKFAKAAALAVSEKPGQTSFNPLVVYGDAGLGKTHLIQAIGNYVRTNLPDKKIAYVTSESFTNDFVSAIRNDKVQEFSRLYRNFDLLMVDDIQFFADKGKTQEEFFHTFNTLHQMGKQIVLTSDRPPKELKQVEERLISRFQWGLVTDIQLPDLETRIAILQKRSEEDGVYLPTDVCEFVAMNITSNIRELEGALIKLLAYSSIANTELTLELAKSVLKDTLAIKKKNLTIDIIQKTVAAYYGIPEDLLRAKTRKKEIVEARQISMYLTKEILGASLKTIGLHFGGRDHSTVIYACKLVEEMISSSSKTKDDIETMKRKIELAGY